MKLRVSYEKEESAIWAKIKLQSAEGDPKEENILDGLELPFTVAREELSISRHFPSIGEAHHWAQQHVNQIAALVRALREPLPPGWEMEV